MGDPCIEAHQSLPSFSAASLARNPSSNWCFIFSGSMFHPTRHRLRQASNSVSPRVNGPTRAAPAPHPSQEQRDHRHHNTGGGIGDVVVPPIYRRNCNQQRHHQKKSAHPFVLRQGLPHTEGNGERRANVRTRENARVDSVIAQHPPVESSKNGVARRDVL